MPSARRSLGKAPPLRPRRRWESNIHPLKTKINLNCIGRFSSYRTVNAPVSIINTGRLRVCSAILTVDFEVRTKHVNVLCLE
jgi:hypothetical protein